jgi:glc operon protein GlcG
VPPTKIVRETDAMKEETMDIVGPSSSRKIVLFGLTLLLMVGRVALAQAPAQPVRPSVAPLISLAEARVIVEGAEAFARDGKMRGAVVVVDTSGNLISADSMDGVRYNDMKGAEGKAFAAAIFREPTQGLGELAKTRPDRYFGIMNNYPGKVYLVGGGVPLVVDGVLVGAVGVAGLPEFVDEKAARAGIAAWDKFRATMKK